MENLNEKQQIEEKAIEEMAKVIEITEQIARDAHCGLPSPRMYAKDLYRKGYRKQSENVIELPCKIGDEIWYIDKKYTVQKAEVTCIDIRSTSRHLIAMRYVWEIEDTIKLALRFDRLNVDYWLSKKEAEEALAKMKGGE